MHCKPRVRSPRILSQTILSVRKIEKRKPVYVPCPDVAPGLVIVGGDGSATTVAGSSLNFCEPSAGIACLSRWRVNVTALNHLKAREKTASNRIPAFFQKTTWSGVEQKPNMHILPAIQVSDTVICFPDSRTFCVPLSISRLTPSD